MALTNPQRARLGRRLDERQRVLLAEIGDELDQTDNREYAKLIGALPGDAGDQSVADALADLNIAIADRHMEELRDVEAAKARMREGSYGTCIDCGGDIAYERLLAYPTAKRCIRCQERREKTYAHEGTPTL
ncbi:MAG: TraR/DksA family transcriptional regulator [Rudaea sp.]